MYNKGKCIYLSTGINISCCMSSCKVILYKSRGEPFLWNRIWDLGWFGSTENYELGCKVCYFCGQFWTKHFFKILLRSVNLESKLSSCDFFQKNEQMNSFLLLCDVFLFILKKLKTPKKPSEIIWPLVSALKSCITKWEKYNFLLKNLDTNFECWAKKTLSIVPCSTRDT